MNSKRQPKKKRNWWIVLTRSKIKEELSKKNLVIEPLNPDHLNPNSVDVTLADKLTIYLEAVLDPKKVNNTRTFTIPKEGIVLIPGELYIAHTNEYTETHGFVPILEGKSSLARLGLAIHVTAGFGDVGFKGQWVLEITVVKPTKIYPNMRIGQLSYHEITGSADDVYEGKYVDQKGNVTSKSYEDFKK